MFDWMLGAIFNLYLAMAMSFVIGGAVGAGVAMLFHHCPEPLTIAGYDDYGHIKVTVPVMDDRVYKL